MNAPIQANWELHAESMAQYYFGWSEPEQAKKWVAQFRQAATPEAARARQATLPWWYAAGLLSQVRSLTLVLSPRHMPWIPVEVTKGIASR
jgi:hypothetical protein